MDKIFLIIGGYIVAATVFKIDPLGLFKTVTPTPANPSPTVNTTPTNTTTNNNTSVNTTNTQGGANPYPTGNTNFNDTDWASWFQAKLTTAVDNLMKEGYPQNMRWNIHQWNEVVRGAGVTNNLPSPEQLGASGSQDITATEYYQLIHMYAQANNGLTGMGNAFSASFEGYYGGAGLNGIMLAPGQQYAYNRPNSSATPAERMLITKH